VKIVANIYEFKIKELHNILCGSIGCTRPAKRKVLFSIGFSANFCEECANVLMHDNIGIVEGVGN
jgi:hypothetical protein